MSLVQASTLLNNPVMSLQTGAEVGRTSKLLVNPANLHVVAFEIQGRGISSAHPVVLRVADVREFSTVGFIIDSADELLEPGDVEAIDTLRSMNFQLNGMKVRDEDGKKYGTVAHYIIESQDLVVVQLEVKSPFLQSIQTTSRLIKREQIVEINADTIIVKSPKIHVTPVTQIERQPLVNPFAQAPADQSPDLSASIISLY